MKDKLQEISERLSTQIAGEIDAHLFESIVSLFSEGVLKHYVRSPRVNLDPHNFNMSVDAASGVRFEGREKIVELQTKLAQTEAALAEARKGLDDIETDNAVEDSYVGWKEAFEHTRKTARETLAKIDEILGTQGETK